jgi:hypothetical protein
MVAKILRPETTKCERERERSSYVPGMWERKREESRRARRDLNNAAMDEAGGR